METITTTFEHTSIEESELLINGGINPETADMMFEILENKTNIYIGYDKEQTRIYPDYYKPCWSCGKLKQLIKNFGYKEPGCIRNSENLIPILLSLQTMKDIKINKSIG